jgi:CheY-like chemotaxis protein
MTLPRILIVDDEPEILRLLARRLTRRGYQVSQASGSQEALVRLRDAIFDLAILDYMMPDTNGLELARQCRTRQPTLQVLILTGSPVTAEIERAGYPCLRKPLENLEHLDETIEGLVAVAQKERAAHGEQ